ncbi:Negative regulator of mitotic exit [Serendipita sp. 399]|nr:Negative regulator of mitotic exit [Serendipita sp. 399]
MNSLFRKRQISNPPATTPTPNVTIAQPASKALAQTRENAERPIASVTGGQSRDLDQSTNVSGPAQIPVQASAPAGNQAPRPTFPWSTRRIALPPPLLLPRPGVPPVTAPSPAPFPRYGHSMPLNASQSGELFIFGGLVRESVRNDLYSFATRDLSATLVQTTGEIPPARVGHASALVSSVLIVWGGDTKQTDSDKQDEGLYLLNLGTREWTRVATRGPAPAGRYGHSVAMVGSRFFVFGGQVDGEFLNDLWSFDLNTLKSAPLWELVRPAPNNEPPPRRTGHIMLALDETLYIFGGTDGSYHYNDTWAFDVNTRTWQELTCIGYIPVPREGHAAALVDDVMYVFGGRGVDGKDLNDLAAFKITTKRWFMFQNMGPAPSGRSGHAMATAGSRIFVLGGESFTSQKPDDPMMIHVLDTKHIKYPDPKGTPPGTRRPSNPSQPSMINGRPMSPPVSSDEDPRRAKSPNGPGVVKGQPFPGQQQYTNSGSPAKRPPTRPARDEIAAQHIRELRDGGETSDSGNHKTMPSQDIRSKSPTHPGTRSMSPGLLPFARSPSPPEPFIKPQMVNGRTSPVVGRPPSTGNIAGDLIRDVRAKEAELETMRRRETWMRAALSKASKAGFSWNDITVEDDEIKGSEPETGDAKKLLNLAFKLKQERASLQASGRYANASIAEQARIATERIAEVERMRAGALQEAAFWRLKVAAYEQGKTNDVVRMETERAAELEKQVSRAHSDRAEAEKKVAELTETLATEVRLREQAEDRISDLTQRAQQAEDALQRASSENSELLEKHAAASSELRSTTEKLFTIQSSQQTRDVDTGSNAETVELRASRDRHLRALEQTQLALKAASARTDEVEEQWKRCNEQLQHLQMEYAELGRELEAKTAEVDAVKAQLIDVENKFAKSREEADALRALTTGSLGELLDYHRDLQADEERVGRAQAEKVRAFQAEAETLREMLQSANDRHEETQADLARERKRLRTIEAEQLALRSQVSGIRSQLSTALADLARARKDIAEKEEELRDGSRKAMDVDLRFKMFRNYLSENGVVVDEEEVANNTSGSKMYELETKLAERNREQDILNRQLRDAREQVQLAEQKVSTLQAELVRARERGGTDADGDARVVEAERRLAEAQTAHNERLQILEQDYRTAVQCVKGTEKMLKKMKEELSKQKGLNASLQAELEGVRSGSEAGSRIRPLNGRATPLSDEGQEVNLRPQLVESQRQTQRLAAENGELHRRLEQLQGDLDRLRSGLDEIQHESVERLNRIEQLEDENAHLEKSLNVARGGKSDVVPEQLHRENITLRRENEQLSQRIQLLLDVNRHPGSQSPNLRASDASLDANMNVDSMSSQLDDWQRRYNTNSANRPISDYDERR